MKQPTKLKVKKPLLLISFLILLPSFLSLSPNAKAGEDETLRKITKALQEAPALKYTARGIEKQYDVRCGPFELDSFEEEDFVASAMCVDKNAKSEEAHGVVITVDGTIGLTSPLLLSTITIGFVG